MADKVKVTTEFLNNVVDVVQFSESLMKKQAALEAALPALVDTLVEQGLVAASKKAAVLESMKDPKYLTESFAKVAAYVKPPEIGESVNVDSSVKTSSDKRESDRVFEDRILRRNTGRSNW